jgi:hypothetical protein
LPINGKRKAIKKVAKVDVKKKKISSDGDDDDDDDEDEDGNRMKDGGQSKGIVVLNQGGGKNKKYMTVVEDDTDTDTDATGIVYITEEEGNSKGDSFGIDKKQRASAEEKSGERGGKEGKKEGKGGVASKGKVVRVYGLYVDSGRNRTSVVNRDINAAVNMVQIINSLINFNEMPWEFRQDVSLKHIPEYLSRAYEYEAKPGETNKHGQIMKFTREEVEWD